MRYIFLLVLVLSISVNAYSQDSVDFSMGGKGGVAVLDRAGPNLSFDWNVAYQRFLFSNNLINLSFMSEKGGDRYKNETTSGGQTICRDTITGETADSQKCATKFIAYYGFSFDVAYSLIDIAHPVYAGVGYRLSSDPTFYGQLNIYFNHLLNKRNGFLKIAAGRNYLDIGVGISISTE